MLEPFQSPVLFLAATEALAMQLCLQRLLSSSQQPGLFAGDCRSTREKMTAWKKGKETDGRPLLSIYRKLRVIPAVQIFYRSYVSYILATTWRKDTNRQTAIIAARSSRHGVPKNPPLRGRNCPTMA